MTVPATLLLRATNDEAGGLGQALPAGGLAVFERTGSKGDLLLADTALRDYPVGQDVEADLVASAQVQAICTMSGSGDFERNDQDDREWRDLTMTITNANGDRAAVELKLGSPAALDLRLTTRGIGKARVKDGEYTASVTVPANGSRSVQWRVRTK